MGLRSHLNQILDIKPCNDKLILMISVVIPAINEEKFLPECLESIRNQDYKGRYEIVVVDNGSTDSTVRIAKRFGARIVKYKKKGLPVRGIPGQAQP